MTPSLQKIKEQISSSDVCEILEYLGAEPEMMGNGTIVSKTISHGGDSRKLFYYANTQLFVDYTDGGNSFDVFELISRVLDMPLNDSLWFVVSFLHLDGSFIVSESDDWAIFDRYQSIGSTKSPQPVELPPINYEVIANYPKIVVSSWVREHIPADVQERFDIRFNPLDSSILIPHNDIDGNLIGVRKRALVESDLEYGKYRPAKVGGKLRNHPLAFNLYGLDKAKSAIKESGIAVVVEGEKSVMQSHAFGIEQTVACCGSALSTYQIGLLVGCGARELVIGFDSDYADLDDPKASEVVSRLLKIYGKASAYLKVSFLWDKEGLLGYKESPFDEGKEVLMHLWKNRVIL